MFGDADGMPSTMSRAEGYLVWDAAGREYVDTTMALGSVSLGYAHPAVTAAARQAMEDGVVGPLAPKLEAAVAELLGALVPHVEAVRFFKTGAEAVAGAVRIARVETGRDRIVTCGYQGWLDPFSSAAGVPAGVRHYRAEVAFNDVDGLEAAVGEPDAPAAIVIEPVVDGPPDPAWVAAVNAARQRSGAVLVLDEIKTGLRLGLGGARARYGFESDLTVFGKALGNGFPIAAVGGPTALMDAATRTWISSTLATEFVSLAAAEEVLRQYEREDVAGHLERAGEKFFQGLQQIARESPTVVRAAKGIPQLCYLECVDEAVSYRLAAACAARQLIFKRDAYNFVSLAHSDSVLSEVLDTVGQVVGEIARDRGA